MIQQCYSTLNQPLHKVQCCDQSSEFSNLSSNFKFRSISGSKLFEISNFSKIENWSNSGRIWNFPKIQIWVKNRKFRTLQKSKIGRILAKFGIFQKSKFRSKIEIFELCKNRKLPEFWSNLEFF